MRKSLTYYLTLIVIRLKGIKKIFSTDPIEYNKLRKDDIHFPPKKILSRNDLNSFQVMNTRVTEFRSNKKQPKLVLFIHGGAFVYGPVKHHWDTIELISKTTGNVVWLCDYPKAPEHKISEISQNIDVLYKMAIDKFGAKNIICIGDSVGATLLITLTQRLIKKQENTPIRLILISPVIDPTFTNPEINQVDSKDIILSREGVLSAKLMCADNKNLKDPLISPIIGSFEKFPEIILFIADYDITYPDQRKFINKLIEANVNNQVFIGKGMPHIWPLLPVMKEAKTAMKTIIRFLD